MTKKMKLVATLATMLIAAAGVMTFEACNKKENVIESKSDSVQNKGIEHPKQIDDMDKYLEEFGCRMHNSKESDILSLEEASWHLTAYQNYQYGDVADDYCGIVYDEKEYTIPVIEGMVSLSDLGVLYNKTAKDIVKNYSETQLENKRIMYVSSEIDEAGVVRMRTAITYNDSSKYYYFHFDSVYDSIVFCDSLFPNTNGYHWEIEAPSILQEQIKQFGPESLRPPFGKRKYYVTIEDKTFNYLNYPGLIFYCGNCSFNATLSPEDMCFYLDSYLYITVENTPTHYELIEVIVRPIKGYVSESAEAPVPIYHEIKVKYGDPRISSNQPVFD